MSKHKYAPGCFDIFDLDTVPPREGVGINTPNNKLEDHQVWVVIRGDKILPHWEIRGTGALLD